MLWPAPLFLRGAPMSKPIGCAVFAECLGEHPAVQAWTRLEPNRNQPEGVETLKLKRKKSAVYQLSGAGPSGSSVIAKRCPLRTGLIERIIHEEYLPRLPVPSLRFYGFIQDRDDAEFCWLFLEDGTAQAYSPERVEDRELAGQWLAMIHTTPAPELIRRRLPSRGPGHYLELLRLSRAAAFKQVANPVLPPEDIATIRAIVAQCDLVESRWAEVEMFCSAIPPVLVHGDLVIKNVRVRSSLVGRALLVFDWEYAGWGVPGTDLCQFTGLTISPDLSAYSACLESTGWPSNLFKPQKLAEYGSIFRLIDDMSWEALSMDFEAYRFLVRPISCLRRYERLMTKALKAVKWM
jgi:Phosphotransferase enzyme family